MIIDALAALQMNDVRAVAEQILTPRLALGKLNPLDRRSRVGKGSAVSKWQQWHRDYDDPESSLSKRLEVVRRYLAQALADAPPPVRLVSLCSGDGRDSIPVIADSGRDVEAVLVELDPTLADAARHRAAERDVPVTVRNVNAGLSSSFADHAPASVLLLCGIFGNISDADIDRTIRAVPSFLAQDAVVIWTRGDHEVDGRTAAVVPSERVRRSFIDTGFTEPDFARPDDAVFRVGMHRWPHPTGSSAAGDQRLFSFLW